MERYLRNENHDVPTAIACHRFRRFNVVGTTGSGKTTFSRRLAAMLAVPHIEMDALFWGPNWHWPNDEEFFSRLRAAIDHDAWVLDGNYTRSLSIKWANVDCVIWLDYSFARTIWQLLCRTAVRLVSQEELWEGTGNRESLCGILSRKSILLWAVQTHWKHRRKYESLLISPDHANIAFVRLCSPNQAEAFLDRIHAFVELGSC